jgi:uncharacterized membrane protein
MNIALWIIAGLLAAAYLIAGLTKLTKSKADLEKNANMGWTQDFSQSAIRGIGAAEVLGAIGLILPQATGIAPILTPIAAVGLVLLQVGAIVVHVRRQEAKVLPVNIVLLLLALFVAVGRFAVG